MNMLKVLKPSRRSLKSLDMARHKTIFSFNLNERSRAYTYSVDAMYVLINVYTKE